MLIAITSIGTNNRKEKDNYYTDLTYLLNGVFVVLAVCTLTAGRSDLWTEDRRAQVLFADRFPVQIY